MSFRDELAEHALAAFYDQPWARARERIASGDCSRELLESMYRIVDVLVDTKMSPGAIQHAAQCRGCSQPEDFCTCMRGFQ